MSDARESVWQLEFVRLIAFPVTVPYAVDQNWWQEVTSLPFENVAPAAQVRPAREYRGAYQETRLALSVDLHRITWEARSPDEVDAAGNFPTLGPHRARVAWFVRLMERWLATACPPVIRLAFSARFLQPAANAKEAYQMLGGYLPTVRLDSQPNDFLMQINRRKETSDVIAGLPINRVCTWSKLNVAIAIEPGKPFCWPEPCYVALEVDVNTAPEKTDVLPSAALASLFQELAALGIDVAERGDVP